MNPPPTPPEEGSQCRARLPSSPPGRGQGWVGSWRASTTFLSRIGTMNRCASQRRGPDRGSATRSPLGSWKERPELCARLAPLNQPTAPSPRPPPPPPGRGCPKGGRGGGSWGGEGGGGRM